MNMPAPVVIRPFRPADQAEVTALILRIQREEYGMTITEADQPDLGAIPLFYQQGADAFLVAEHDGSTVGTIGLKDLGDNQAALRKMFVAAAWRGRPHAVAQRLLDALLAQARAQAIRTVLLGTTEQFTAAHHFYERNGFARIKADSLPATFPRMAVDTRFYRIALD